MLFFTRKCSLVAWKALPLTHINFHVNHLNFHHSSYMYCRLSGRNLNGMPKNYSNWGLPNNKADALHSEPHRTVLFLSLNNTVIKVKSTQWGALRAAPVHVATGQTSGHDQGNAILVQYQLQFTDIGISEPLERNLLRERQNWSECCTVYC